MQRMLRLRSLTSADAEITHTTKAAAAALGRRFSPGTRDPRDPHVRRDRDPFGFLRTSACSKAELHSMRNPRALMITQQLAVQHRSVERPPPRGSLFWQLWQESREVSQAALETPFIQGIAKGTLDPVTYGRFNVSDAYFCFHAAEDYALAAERAQDVALKMYLHAKHVSYRTYNAAFPRLWHLRDASGIQPSAVCEEYSVFERSVVRTEKPIYGLIAMLPCEHLWAWLGSSIGPRDDSNLYKRWVTENADFGTAFSVGNVVADYQRRHPGSLDVEKAQRIYTQAMKYEWQNFATA